MKASLSGTKSDRRLTIRLLFFLYCAAEEISGETFGRRAKASFGKEFLSAAEQ